MALNILAVLALIAGFFLLEAGADRFTAGIGLLALRLRASESVVGLLTAGGEWEELIVVVAAILSGHPGLAVGNVIGSCLANLIGSLPLGLFGARPLVPDRSARIYALVMVAVTLIASVFLIDGTVAPVDGGILVVLFAVYAISIVLVLRRGWLRPLGDDDDDDDLALPASLPRLIALLVVTLAVIAGGAELTVWGATRIASWAGLSDYAIGATIVAIGTTLPDKAISFVGGRRGQGGIVTANATGSNIFVLTLVLGLAGLFSGGGLHVAHNVARIDTPLLIAATLLITALFFRASIHWRAGMFLLTLYGAYIVYALVR